MSSINDISPTLSPFEALYIRQLDLENQLDSYNKKVQLDGSFENVNYEKNLVFNYLEKVSSMTNLRLHDYFKDFSWFNVSENLSLTHLEGRIVVCDFFTYCCINCLHILPILNQIEKTYKNENVQFIGVHSPKFSNEKSFQNVASAILKYNILHPVCNDTDLVLWKHLAIFCWPTIAIIDPNSKLLFLLVGENAIEKKLKFYLDICLDFFRKSNCFSDTKLSISLNLLKDSSTSNILYFPTKISMSPTNSRVAIANTLKNSLIIAEINGLVEHIIGSNNIDLKGFLDGPFEVALFNCPQGITWLNDQTLFVCDTENHAIRKIDLNNKLVSTIAGNGIKSSDIVGGKIGKNQGLNSPWDLTYDECSQRLYIAMAGSHQIWLIILLNKDLIDGIEHPYGTCIRFAGDGQEQKRNNRHLLKSSFAQPSGITIKNNKLYVADSESSSIREIKLEHSNESKTDRVVLGDITVSTIVGGAADPLDLFAFGDMDGIGLKCKLQHCMGVCSDNEEDIIYLADTFNHKIKKVYINSKKCETLHFEWENESSVLSEPNGLCYYTADAVKYILICDTNNHRLLSLNLNSKVCSNFNLFRLEKKFTKITISDNIKDDILKIEETIDVFIKQKFLIELDFNLENLKSEKEASHNFKITSEDSTNLIIHPISFKSNTLNNINFEIIYQGNEPMTTSLMIHCFLNMCNDKLNFCKFLYVRIEQPIQFIKSDYSFAETAKKCINIKI